MRRLGAAACAAVLAASVLALVPAVASGASDGSESSGQSPLGQPEGEAEAEGGGVAQSVDLAATVANRLVTLALTGVGAPTNWWFRINWWGTCTQVTGSEISGIGGYEGGPHSVWAFSDSGCESLIASTEFTVEDPVLSATVNADRSVALALTDGPSSWWFRIGAGTCTAGPADSIRGYAAGLYGVAAFEDSNCATFVTGTWFEIADATLSATVNSDRTVDLALTGGPSDWWFRINWWGTCTQVTGNEITGIAGYEGGPHSVAAYSDSGCNYHIASSSFTVPTAALTATVNSDWSVDLALTGAPDDWWFRINWWGTCTAASGTDVTGIRGYRSGTHVVAVFADDGCGSHGSIAGTEFVIPTAALSATVNSDWSVDLALADGPADWWFRINGWGTCTPGSGTAVTGIQGYQPGTHPVWAYLNNGCVHPIANSSFTIPEAGSAPAAPTAPTLVSGDRQIAASWAAPAVNNSPVIDYDVRHCDASTGCDAPSEWTEHFDKVSYSPARRNNVASDGSAGNALDLGTISLTGVTVTKPTISGVSNVYRLGTAVGGLRLAIWGQSDNKPTYQARYAKTAPSSSNMMTHGTLLWTNSTYLGTGTFNSVYACCDGWTPAVPSGTYFWIAPSSSDSVDFFDVTVEADTASTGLSRTLTGLTNGTAYEVQVRAGNANGDSAWSASSTIKAGLPAAPDAPALEAGGGGVANGTSLTATWAAPSGNGSTVTGYGVRYSSDSGATWQTATHSGTTTSVAITGLTAATAYVVQVRAVSSVGNGPWSASSAARKPGAPGTVATPTSASGNAQLTVSWDAPADHGSAVTDYDVQYRACANSSDLSCATSPSWGAWTDRTGETGSDTTRSATLSGLTNNTAYEVQVRAANSVGEGAWSPTVTDRPGRPDAPGAPTVTAGARKLDLSWTAPTTNGLAIDGYDVQYRVKDTDSMQSGNQPGDWTAHSHTGTGTTALITGLEALEEYEVQVRAESTAGEGPWSAVTSGTTTADKPDAPAAPTLSAGTTSLTVKWPVPAHHGQAITGYGVQYRACTNSSDLTCATNPAWASSWTSHAHTGTDAEATIGTLTAGTAYQVQVQATNSIGTSAWSAAATRVVGAPGAPTGLTASGSDASLILSWTAAAANGATVNDYDIRYRQVGATSWTRVLSPGAGWRDWKFTNQQDASNATDNPIDWGSWGPNFTTESLGSHAGLYKAKSHIDEMWAYFTIPYSNASGLTARLCKSSTKPTGNLYTTTSPCTLAAESTAAHRTGSTWDINFGSSGSGVRVADIPKDGYVWMATSSAKTTNSFRGRTIFSMDLRSTALTEDLGGLTNGTAYEVQVRAGNTRGDGAWSATATGTPSVDPPDAVTAITLVSGNQQIAAIWTAPDDNGSAVIDYDVRHRVQNSSTWTEHFDKVSYSAARRNNVTSDASAGNALDLGTISLTGVTVTKPTISGVSNVYRLGTAVGGLRLQIEGQSTNKPTYRARYAKTAPSSSNMATHGTQVWSSGGNQFNAGGYFGPPPRNGGFDGWTPTLPSGTYFWVAADSNDEVDFLDATVEADTASTTLSRTVTGLTNNTAYEVQVRAGNANGDGAWSASSTIKAGLPATPDAPKLEAGGGGVTNGTSLTATWTAPSGNGSTITGYGVRYSSDSGATWQSVTHSGTTASVVITGLTAATAYVVQVRATGSVGNGPWSASSAARKPGAPATVATPTSASGNAQLTVSWTAPANHGSAVTDYDVQYRACTATDVSCATSPSWGAWTDRTGETASDTTRSATLTGLTNNTAYEVQVRAANSIGEGAWSPAVTDRPGRPPAPSAPTVTAGARQLSVSWSAPSTNGLAVTDYDVQYRVTDTDSGQSGDQPGAWTSHSHTGTGISATITLLTALEEYDVQVRASSTAGAGPWSPSASGTTLAGAPNTPAAPSVAAGGTQITASWKAPTTNGAAITDYDVRYCDTSTGCDAANEWTELNDTSTNATDTSLTATITGLTADKTYVVQVRAGAGVLNSDWSPSSDAIAAGAPTAPTGITATGKDGLLTVTWTASSTGNGANVNDYDVRYRQVGTTRWTRLLSPGAGWQDWKFTNQQDASNATDNPIDWGDWGPNFTTESLGSHTGLYKANSHIDEMRAYFTIPYSNASGLTARLCKSSTKPTGNLYTTTSPCTLAAESTAAHRTGSTWDINFGSSGSGVRVADIPKDGYVWMATSSAKTTNSFRGRTIFSMDLRSTALLEDVGGLTNGTSYEVQVRAGNSRGNGEWSATATGTPSNTAPTALSAPTLASGNSRITATWSAGDSSVFDYDVRHRVQNASNWTEHFDKVKYEPGYLSGSNHGSNATTGSGLTLGNISLTGVTVSKVSTGGISNVYRLGTDVGGLRIRVNAVSDHEPGTGYQARYAATAPTTSNMATHGTQIWSVTSYNNVGRFIGDAWAPALPAGSYFWVAAGANDTADSINPIVEADTPSTALSRTLGGLSNGTTYEVQVRAGNANGDSPWSSGTTIKAGLPAAPDAPGLEAGGGGVTNGTSLTISWSAPDSHGNPVTDYDVQYSSDAGATWTEWNATNNSTATSAAVTGLTAATSYVVRVRAANSVGNGPWSASSAARKPGAPATPATPTSASGNASLTISWTAPATHGSAITDYDVQYRACTANDLSCATSPAWGAWTDRSGETGTDTARSATLSTLTNGTAYQARVRAANSVGGEGAWSAAVTDLPGRPPAPAAPGLTAGTRQLGVTWTAPTANGLAVTDYDVQYRVTDTNDTQTGDQPGDWTAHSHTGLGTSATITGLTAAEEYDVQVRASSSAGAGPWSASASQTTLGTAPDAPAAPTVVPAGTSISVSWTAPATHGSAINDYDVRYSSDSGTTWTSLDDTGDESGNTALSDSVTGLTAATTYVVQVRAGSTAGDSAWSASSHAIAAGAPTLPGSVTAASGDQSLSVTWTTPTTNNGAAVNDYDVRYSSDSGATWTSLDDTGTNATDTTLSATVSGLTNGTAYEVQVRAGNSNGNGPWTASATGTPRAPQPSAPTAPTLVSGNSQITASWAVPAINGTAVIDYDVRHRVQNSSTWSEHFDTVTPHTPASRNDATSNASTGAALDLGTISLTGVTVTKPTISGVSNVYRLGTAVGGLRLSIAGQSENTPAYQARYASSAPSSSNMATHGKRIWRSTSFGGGGYFGPNRPSGGFEGWSPALPSGTYFWVAADSSDIVDFLDVTVGAETASTTLSRTITGLNNNTAYEVQVRAGNAHGDGPWSSGTIIKAGLPAAPDTPDLDAGSVGVTDGTSLTATWSAVDGHGNTVIDYDVQYSTDSGATWTEWNADNTSTTTRAALTGLTASTEYLVQARAVNSVGNGPWSASSEARKPGAPATPAAPTSASGNASLTISWTAPAAHGSAITDYDVRYRICTATDVSCATSPSWGVWTNRTGETATDTALTATLSTLTNNTAYEVQVRAGNSVGESAWSAVIDRPGRPPAPTVNSVTAGTRQLTVSWTAPTTNGLALTDYDVQYRITDTKSGQTGDQPGAWTDHSHTGLGTSATITGLTALEEYDVQVRASSSAGPGPWSASMSGTAAAAKPDAPAAPTLVAGNAELAVSWEAPGSNGSDINDYDVRYSSDSGTTWTSLDDTGDESRNTTLSDTITGLTNGTTYVVQVRAGNDVGDSDWSASSDAVAAGAPANPGSVTATAGDAKLTVTWAAPTANNGDNVNDYDVRYRQVGAANWIRVLSPGVGRHEWGFLETDTANSTDNPLDWGDWGTNFTKESLGSHGGLYKANSHIDEMWAHFVVPYQNPPSNFKARLCKSTSKPTGNLYTTASPCTLAAERSPVQWSGPNYNVNFGTTSSGVRIADIPQNGYVWMATSAERTTRGNRSRTIFPVDLRSTTLSEEVTGLTNGTAYEVQVRAGNARGNGAWSAPYTATPTAS